MKALVVDDDQHLRDLVTSYLEREGFTVYRAIDGRVALDLARQHTPDIIILDLMLPHIDGLEVCRRLRTFSDAYVLMLTAKTEEVDRIIGLELGADDYLAKPFSPRELIARVRAMLRRPRHGSTIPSEPNLRMPQHFGSLVIDHDRHEVLLADIAIALTPIEFSLLATLAMHPGHVFTRLQLIEHVWGQDYYGDDHVVDVHIANLRKKLIYDSSTLQVIQTVRGIGYRFAARLV